MYNAVPNKLDTSFQIIRTTFQILKPKQVYAVQYWWVYILNVYDDVMVI